MLRILFATTELAPWIKTGGLADVSAALPRALLARGAQVTVMLPRYRAWPDLDCNARALTAFEVLGHPVRILAERRDGLELLLVDCPGLFDRDGGPYSDPDGHDHRDNAVRYTVFCRAIEQLVRHASQHGVAPDVVHLNDWPSALAAGFLAGWPGKRPRVVFSLHNLAHRGLFAAETFSRLSLPTHWWSMHGVEFHGQLSLLKAGIVYADAVTTVSPGYCQEIQLPAHGNGLDGLLRHVSGKLVGIVNGIDETLWNPAADAHLVAPFGCSTLQRKRLNKAALQQHLGMARDATVPLLGFIGRLAEQKGVDLIANAADTLIAMPAQLVVLGCGEARFEHALRAAEQRHPGRLRFVAKLDERLAHRIEAGADIFLMPSRFEPCGLNQMYSMRYGTVPVVRRTGGLADTVRQVRGPEVGAGTGFLFDDPTPDALISTLGSALELFRNPAAWRRIQHNGMSADFSWRCSATRYLQLYRSLTQRASAPAGP